MSKEHYIPELPYSAENLVPHRPPMLLVDRLMRRDRGIEYAEVEAVVPAGGVFVAPAGAVLPEYFIELMAQAMAAVNGYDCLCDGLDSGRGFLVGVENFSWLGGVICSETLKVEIEKTFEFGAVTVMSGRVINTYGELLASGEIKVWEEK